MNSLTYYCGLFLIIFVTTTTTNQCYASIVPKYISWIDGHQSCVRVFNDTLCTDSPYIVQARLGLKEAKSSYHTNIYKAIIDLYDDLDLARKPRSIFLQELNRTLQLHPVSFSIPEDLIRQTVPFKSKSFGQVIPGDQSTYFHLSNESQYYHDLERSLLTLTYRKGGWDCLRHYEILAHGSLPLFVDIKECPVGSLIAHPKKLYELLLTFPGLQLTASRKDRMTMKFDKLDLDIATVDKQLYVSVAGAMLQYTRNILSTEAMASYILHTIQSNSQHKVPLLPKKVLYLSHSDHDMDKGDYLTDFNLHGFKCLLGDAAVVDFPHRAALYKTDGEFHEQGHLTRKQQLYGGGSSWSLRLADVLEGTNERQPDVVRDNIINRRYDLVILGSGHRDGWASKLFFWDLICTHYSPLEVGFIEGSDNQIPQNKNVLKKYAPCAGHLFSREGYGGS